MPESLRKKRQQARRSPEEELADTIRGLLSSHNGATLETHTAGYWTELGLTVNVPPQLEDRKVVELGNQLLDAIRGSAFARESSWTWSLGIYREGELVSSLDQRSEPRLICSECGYVQERALGNTCLQCRSRVA